MLGSYEHGIRNESNLKALSRINWRASLVPAAAVIPAPIAYINIAAVKKLVVGYVVCLNGVSLAIIHLHAILLDCASALN